MGADTRPIAEAVRLFHLELSQLGTRSGIKGKALLGYVKRYP